jgi:hypothetical protein
MPYDGWVIDAQGQSASDLLKILPLTCYFAGSPNGIRIRVSTLRGLCPRPLDDGAKRVQFRPRPTPAWSEASGAGR